jgi:hypothetical protein
VAVADLNNDGASDLAVANSFTSSVPGSVSVLLGNGRGGFGAGTLVGQVTPPKPRLS